MKIWKHKKRLIAFTLTVSIGLSAALPALGTSPVSAAQPDPLEVSVSPSAIQGDGGTAGQSIRQQEGIVQESLKLFGVAPAAYTAGTISGTSSEEGQTAATVFKVTQPYITLRVGSTAMVQLDRTVSGLTWTSSNSEVATVDSTGKVTGLKMGRVKITATAPDGGTASCMVSVGFYTGIDVSVHNNSRKPCDWELVKEQGIDFAMIRASFGWMDFPEQNDLNVEANVAGALAVGLPIGLYHYSYATNAEEAVLEAEYVIRLLNESIPEYKDQITLPIAYDIEESKVGHYTMSGEQLTEIAMAFCDRIQEEGYQPAIYGPTNILKKMDWDALKGKGYKVWYGHPKKSDSEFLTYHTIYSTDVQADIWQYSFSEQVQGAIASGITDLNLIYMSDDTVSSLEATTITGQYANNQMYLNWEPVTNATKYLVYRAGDNGDVKIVGSTIYTTFTDTDIPQGGPYSYYVMAVHENMDLLKPYIYSPVSNIVKTPVVLAPGTEGVTLDTQIVYMIGGISVYDFLVRGNNDVDNLVVESSDPNIASVEVYNAGDSRGAKYRITAKQAGTVQIQVTYQGDTASFDAVIYPVGGSIMLDTVNYQMSPGDVYDIGVTIKDGNGRTLTGEEVQEMYRDGILRVSDSRTGSIVNLQQLANGNFRVTGRREGTCYIVYEVYQDGERVTHASVKIDVAQGTQAHGASTRDTSYWADKSSNS